MKKFQVRFQREFEVQIDAESIEAAAQLARQVLAQFPANSTKLLSILPEGYVEAPEQPSPPPKPFGRPNGGGTPGTPVVRTEVLVDQIAEAA